MAYGDRMNIGKIKESEINTFIKKDIFQDITDGVRVHIKNTNEWYYTLEFDTRKDWFNFVRHINKLNKKFKKMPKE